jgi:3-oxoacyl-[acyl-carrier-protein] synthase II
MYARRIFITSLGAITPLGLNVESFWRALTEGRSGVAAIQNICVGDFQPNFAAEVKNFAPEAVGISKRKARFMGRHAQLALAAAIEANAQSNLKNAAKIAPSRIGTILGVGMLGPLAPDAAKIGNALGAVREAKLKELNACASDADAKSSVEAAPPRAEFANSNNSNSNELNSHKLSSDELFDMQTFGRIGAPQLFPLWLLRHIPNLTGGHLSIELDTQAALNTITNGCVSAANALGEAARVIARGDADICFTGGADARVNPLAMLRYRDVDWLATNDAAAPQNASAPFDETARGFVNGEGAGMLVLEAEDAAQARGAEIYAEVLSYAAANDAHDALRPHAEGRGLARAVAKCLRQAEVSIDAIDVVFAPANGIPEFDAACACALRTAFHARTRPLTVTATRAALGHTHAASTALDLIAAVKSLESGIVPPVLNLKNPIREAREFDFVTGAARDAQPTVALVAAYGFGGHAAAILLRRCAR